MCEMQILASLSSYTKATWMSEILVKRSSASVGTCISGGKDSVCDGLRNASKARVSALSEKRAIIIAILTPFVLSRALEEGFPFYATACETASERKY